MAYKIEQGIATWTPADNPKATGDPYKTLFVSRIVICFFYYFSKYTLEL